eukprot:8407781-Prorocentrum_lima.AAC.1
MTCAYIIFSSRLDAGHTVWVVSMACVRHPFSTSLTSYYALLRIFLAMSNELDGGGAFTAT